MQRGSWLQLGSYVVAFSKKKLFMKKRPKIFSDTVVFMQQNHHFPRGETMRIMRENNEDIMRKRIVNQNRTKN